MGIQLMDEQDGAFGKFYGHPEGNIKSQQMVKRLLKEFSFGFNYFKNIIANVPLENIERIPALNEPLKNAFVENNWESEPNYPESIRYKADLGYCLSRKKSPRWIFVEIELSDVRRAVNAFYMSRVFRTGYMRLGIIVVPEITYDMFSQRERKTFYTTINNRYSYLCPDYPLWVIGFDIVE